MKFKKIFYLLTVIATPAFAEMPKTLQGIWAGSPEDCIDSQIIIGKNSLADQVDLDCVFEFKTVEQKAASGKLLCNDYSSAPPKLIPSNFAFELSANDRLKIVTNPFPANDYYAKTKFLIRCSG